jgi:beta-lactamase regulating signal transducer with metallopeptidase domain
MTAMVAMLLSNTLTAAALAGIVLLVCRCGRVSPAARHALWLVVIVKLVSPLGFVWSLPLPLAAPGLFAEPSHSRKIVTATRTDVPEMPALLEEHGFVMAVGMGPEEGALAALAPDAPDLAGVKGVVPATGTEASGPRVPSPGSSTPATEGFDLSFLWWWLEIFWLGGATLVAARYLWKAARFSRYAHAGEQAAPSLQRQVEELAALLRVRAPRVRVLADLPSPVICCLLRPVLLWPQGLQDQLSAAGCRAVVIHELAHLRRRDHWVRWLELTAAVLYWWNPLFWFVRRRLRFYAELACDAWVTDTLPEMRRDYAEALVDVCARSSRAAAPSLAVGVGGDGRRDFRRRLTMIMRDHVPCRLAAGAKVFVALLLVAALPAWTFGQAQVDPGTQPQVEIRTIQLKDLKPNVLDNLAVDIQLIGAGADAETARKVKEIEARIVDLQNQLQALKTPKAAADPKKKSPGQPWVIRGGDIQGKILILMVDPKTGKVVQSTGDAPKDAIRVEVQLPPQVRMLLQGLDAGAKKPRYKVIGPDGQEIKGATVIPLDPKADPLPQLPWLQELVPGKWKIEARKVKVEQVEDARKRIEEARKQVEKALGAVRETKTAVVKVPRGPGDKVINLSRATYKLSKDKATTLAAFLKENVKASVLELKVDEQGLTVTTTPEAQAVIGGIVRLMTQGHVQTQPMINYYYRALRLEPEKK